MTSYENMQIGSEKEIRSKARLMASAMWSLSELTHEEFRVKIELKNGTRLSDEWLRELTRLLETTPSKRVSVYSTTFGIYGLSRAVEVCGNSELNRNAGWEEIHSSTAGSSISEPSEISSGCSTSSCSEEELGLMLGMEPILELSPEEMFGTKIGQTQISSSLTPVKAGLFFLRRSYRLSSAVGTLRTQLNSFVLKAHQSKALEESLVALESSLKELRRSARLLMGQEEES